jgi:hypothetical protein
VSLRVSNVEDPTGKGETLGRLEGGHAGGTVISSRLSTPSNGGHLMRSAVNTTDDTVTRVSHVDEIRVSSNATGISKQGFLTGGIGPPCRTRADDVLHLPGEVKNHHAMVVRVRNE